MMQLMDWPERSEFQLPEGPISTCFVEKIAVFTGGGLLSVVQISGNEAKIFIDWPEEMTIESMKFVASVLSEFKRQKRNILTGKSWAIYSSEGGHYIILVFVNSNRYVLPAVGLSKTIFDKLKNVPEEANLVGELIIDTLHKFFRCNFKVMRARYESLDEELLRPSVEFKHA